MSVSDPHTYSPGFKIYVTSLECNTGSTTLCIIDNECGHSIERSDSRIFSIPASMNFKAGLASLLFPTGCSYGGTILQGFVAH